MTPHRFFPLALFAVWTIPLMGCTPTIDWPDPLSVEPADGGQIIRHDVDGDGRVDYVQEAYNGLKVRFAFDLDEDGFFEQTVRRDALNPNTTRHLLVLLSGVPFELMREMYQEGHFRLFHPPGRLIGTFPSLTDPIFSRAFHCGLCPGYQASYYNRAKNKTTNGLLAYVRGTNRRWWQALDYRLSPWLNGRMHSSPLTMFRHELAAARRALDKSTEDRVVVYVASTDAICHALQWPQAKQQLLELDHWLERLFFDYRADIHITVFGDHGNNFTPSRRVDLEQALEQAGLKLHPRLRGPYDVALPKSKLVGFASLFTRSAEARRRVVAACRRLPGVELVIYQDGPSPYAPIVVAREDAVARIFYRQAPAASQANNPPKARYRYETDPTQGDPLQLAQVVHSLRAEGLFDEEGFAPEDIWFRATRDHVFPDALRRVHESLHAAAVNGADVVLSLADGWYVGSRQVDLFTDIRGTHGSLRDTSSTTFLMSTAFPPPEFLRHADLLVEINRHFRWVPRIPGVVYDRVVPNKNPQGGLGAR